MRNKSWGLLPTWMLTWIFFTAGRGLEWNPAGAWAGGSASCDSWSPGPGSHQPYNWGASRTCGLCPEGANWGTASTGSDWWAGTLCWGWHSLFRKIWHFHSHYFITYVSCIFLEQIRENHRQKEKAIKSFSDFVARTSNHLLLKVCTYSFHLCHLCFQALNKSPYDFSNRQQKKGKNCLLMHPECRPTTLHSKS